MRLTSEPELLAKALSSWANICSNRYGASAFARLDRDMMLVRHMRIIERKRRS